MSRDLLCLFQCHAGSIRARRYGRTSRAPDVSSTHPRKENCAENPEYDTWSPGRNFRGYEPVTSESLGKLHEKDEDHGGAQCKTDSVRGAAPLSACRKGSREEKDDHAGDRYHDLEHALHLQHVDVSARALH